MLTGNKSNQMMQMHSQVKRDGGQSSVSESPGLWLRQLKRSAGPANKAFLRHFGGHMDQTAQPSFGNHLPQFTNRGVSRVVEGHGQFSLGGIADSDDAFNFGRRAGQRFFADYGNTGLQHVTDNLGVLRRGDEHTDSGKPTGESVQHLVVVCKCGRRRQ